jgi:hypothetical protein
MKHAGAATLELLGPLLREIRKRPQLREKSPGSFYVKSKGYLHFHEDPAGIFADVKLDFAEFTRVRATTEKERKALLAKIDKSLAALS